MIESVACHWCGKSIALGNAVKLYDKYVCDGCYANIYRDCQVSVEVECVGYSRYIPVTKDLYCASCYKKKRTLT
jgi:hypothetical protein